MFFHVSPVNILEVTFLFFFEVICKLSEILDHMFLKFPPTIKLYG